jgi:hypothetical protein
MNRDDAWFVFDVDIKGLCVCGHDYYKHYECEGTDQRVDCRSCNKTQWKYRKIKEYSCLYRFDPLGHIERLAKERKLI